MHEILGLLKVGAYPNCPRIAAELEVSEKSAWRDIEFMRDRMNLPIEYDASRHGFYLSGPADFPSVQVSEAELFSLIVAHKAIDQYRGTPFAAPLRAAFDKITAQLDAQRRYSLGNWTEFLSFRPFAPEETKIHDFELVTRALLERRTLAFDYETTSKNAQRSVQGQGGLGGGQRHPYLERSGRAV